MSARDIRPHGAGQGARLPIPANDDARCWQATGVVGIKESRDDNPDWAPEGAGEQDAKAFTNTVAGAARRPRQPGLAVVGRQVDDIYRQMDDQLTRMAEIQLQFDRLRSRIRLL